MTAPSYDPGRYYALTWLISSEQVYCAMMAAAHGFQDAVESAFFCCDLSFSKPTGSGLVFDFTQAYARAFLGAFKLVEETFAATDARSCVSLLRSKIQDQGPLLISASFGRSPRFFIDTIHGSINSCHYSCLATVTTDFFEFCDFKTAVRKDSDALLSDGSFRLSITEMNAVFSEGFTLRSMAAGPVLPRIPSYTEVIDEFLNAERPRFSTADFENLVLLNALQREEERTEGLALANGLDILDYATWRGRQRVGALEFHGFLLGRSAIGDENRRARCLELVQSRIRTTTQFCNSVSLSKARGAERLNEGLLESFANILREDHELKDAFSSWRRQG